MPETELNFTTLPSHPDSPILDYIKNVKKIPQERFQQTCEICNLKGRGQACIQCSNKRCHRSYHIPCAIKAGYTFRINEDLVNKTSVENKTSSIDLFQSFCGKHSLDYKNEEDKTCLYYPKSNYNANMSLSLRGSSPVISDDRRERIEEIYRNFFDLAPTLAEKTGFSEEDFGVVRTYWRLKRTRNNNRPLLDPTQYYDLSLIRSSNLPEVKEVNPRRSATEPASAVKEEKESLGAGKGDQEADEASKIEIDPEEVARVKQKLLIYHHLRKNLRQNIEKSRTLCALTITRERLKKQAIQKQQDEFNLEFAEKTEVSGD